MGMRGMVQNTVYLDDVPVHAAQMLGQPGAGMAVAQEAMMYGRLAIAAASVGAAGECVAASIRCGYTRAPFQMPHDSAEAGPRHDRGLQLATCGWHPWEHPQASKGVKP